MLALVVTFQVKPERLDAFIEALLEDAQGSVRDEPGCFRFDVVQDQEDPNRLHLYEVYQDEAALEAHRQAPHFKRFFGIIKDWHTADPVRRIATTVFPPDSDWSK
jgi:quinol monooxygenase YgiN